MSTNRDEQAGALFEQTLPRRTDEIAARSSLTAPASDSSRFGPQASDGVGRSTEIHIEELVLHGFEPSNRVRIGEAFQRELTRLFADQGPPTLIRQGGGSAHVDGGEFQMRPGSTADAIGGQIAIAVYRGLSR